MKVGGVNFDPREIGAIIERVMDAAKVINQVTSGPLVNPGELAATAVLQEIAAALGPIVSAGTIAMTALSESPSSPTPAIEALVKASEGEQPDRPKRRRRTNAEIAATAQQCTCGKGSAPLDKHEMNCAAQPTVAEELSAAQASTDLIPENPPAPDWASLAPAPWTTTAEENAQIDNGSRPGTPHGDPAFGDDPFKVN